MVQQAEQGMAPRFLCLGQQQDVVRRVTDSRGKQDIMEERGRKQE